MNRVVLVFALLAWAIVACWPSAAVLGTMWMDIDHAHGYVVAAASFWLIFRDRQAIDAAPARVSVTGFVGLVLASVAWAVTWRAGLQALHLVLVPVMMGLAVYAAFGFGVASRLAFPLAYLYLGLPVWEIFNDTLQWLTVHVTDLALQAVRIPARVEGNFVHLSDGIFEVASGCSGLHFFIVGIALAALLGELEKQSLVRRSMLIVVMTALSMIANWIRVIVIVIAGYTTHMQHYLVRKHTGFGWIVFTVVVALFLWISRRMLSPPVAAAQSPAPEASRPLVRPLPYVAAAVVLAIPLAASVIPTVRERGTQSKVAIQLPGGTGAWHQASATSVSTWRPVFKGDPARSYVVYDDGQGHQVEAFGVVYTVQRQGAELVGFDNSLLGSMQTEGSTQVVRTPSGPFREVETTDSRGSRALVWYAYDIAGQTFANPLFSQLWYGATSILTERASALFAFRARCSIGCDSARQTLTRFAADMTPDVRTAVRTLLPPGSVPAVAEEGGPELASSGTPPAELLKQGLEALQKGDFAHAESALIAAHDGDPAALTTEQHSLALLGIVDARMAQGKMRDAEVAYDALARLAPNALPTRVVSAQIQMAKGNVSDAVAGLQRLVLAQPGYAPARLLLARGLLLQGNLYQAEVQLQAVLQAVPGHPGATALLDQIHHRIASGSSGDRGGAGPATAAGQPFAMARNPAVLNNQAWEYFQRGDLRAEELARQAHELAPNHPEIADTYGWILLRLRHDHQRALPLLEAAAKGAPRNPEIQYHYASALAASGRRVEAGSILKATLASGAAFASRQEAQSLFQSVAAQRP